MSHKQEMAQQQHQDTPKIGFRSIQLLKTQTLGIGSYGSVCKALCDDLLCAAKIIHSTLIDPNAHKQIERQKEHRLPISRFIQECEFVSAIRHPNIVQYLGMHQDPETRLPVLLMELMDDSLTHFLESSQNEVPYHTQVTFCHDITMAISYLHSNGITHRDLSSNNVLLRGIVQAKVTDFGMAMLDDLNTQATQVSFTMCPGTDVYMPPEAVKDKPEYTAKIDCFAIGTLIIQILSRCFPDPGVRQKAIQIEHPQLPGGTVYAPVPEIERRNNHISQVDPNHPLLPIALDCLKDSDVDRPSAQELCHSVAALKEAPEFIESVSRSQNGPEQGNTTEREEELKQQIQDKDDEIRQMRQEHDPIQQIQELQQTIETQNNFLHEKNDIIQERNDIIRQNADIIQQKDQLVDEKERHLQHITQQHELVISQLQAQIQELEQQLKRKSSTDSNWAKQSVRDPPQIHSSTHGTSHIRVATRDSFTLSSREVKKAPFKMSRATNAIVDGDIVYIRAAGTRNIYAYKSTDERWDQLPECETGYFSLAIVKNLLTTIGGRDNDSDSELNTNKLFSLTGNHGEKQWKVLFQSMPTKRASAVTVCAGQALIVAGGIGQEEKRLRTVEVMDIEKNEWTSAANLPKQLSEASITICDDRIYIIGGWNDHSEPTKSVYMCTLTDLFLSCQSRSLRERLVQSRSPTSPPRGSTVWVKVADPPVVRSTCVTIHGRLLTIGGKDSVYGLPTSDIYIYHPTFDKWEVISNIIIGRWSCFAAVLPTNKLLVVGGYTNSRWLSETDSVEIAIIV